MDAETGTFLFDRDAFPDLFAALHARGYSVVGPTARDGAIVYDELVGVDDLPIGWTDEQEGAVYRLKRREDAALFGFNAGPHAWKKFMHPSGIRLTHARRENGEWRVEEETNQPKKYAFLGVRACDPLALAGGGEFLDREGARGVEKPEPKRSKAEGAR